MAEPAWRWSWRRTPRCVPVSKTQADKRIIPLNDDALGAMRALYSRSSAVDGTHRTTMSFPPSRMSDSSRRRPRRVGAQPGEVCGRPQAYPRCASMISGITQSQSWLNRRPVTRPSWRSPGMILGNAGALFPRSLGPQTESVGRTGDSSGQFGGQTNPLRQKQRHNAAFLHYQSRVKL